MLNVNRVAVAPRERAWDAVLTARMNVIYWQRRINRVSLTDKALRLGAGLLSSVGVYAALKFFHDDRLTIGAGVLAAVINTFTLVLGHSEEIRTGAALLPQYVEHANRLERLFDQGDAMDIAELDKAIAALDQTQVVEAEKARGGDSKLLEQAQLLVMKQIGANRAPATG